MTKFKYKEQHAVIIKCDDERDQKATFERLKKLGYNQLKVVSV